MTSIVKPPLVTEPHPQPEGPQVGQWYWVKEHDEEEGDSQWLGCVIHVGSNYAEIRSVSGGSVRVHLNELDDTCEFIPDPDNIIDGEIDRHQKELQGTMAQIQQLTTRLAITPNLALSAPVEAEALVVYSGQAEAYKTALVLAKEETLPDLFKQVEKISKDLAQWMKAKIIPLRAQAREYSGLLEVIEQRIFHVELYTGLVEKVVRVREGNPAPMEEKIHLFQRRAYMDEECLARYEAGGMDFNDIEDFDRWLARDENLNRLLPFPKCVLAFRVRRERKDREAINLRDFIRMFQEENLDKTTFLYMRNGEQLFRLRTAIEFEEQLFPDVGQSDLSSGKVWAEMFCSDVKGLISENAYQAMLEEEERKRKAYEEEGDPTWPFHTSRFYQYERFSPESVYYDDIAKHIQKEITKHNRVVLVLQGLLDRSPVFHPHPPWSLWTPQGFEQGLELIYDESRALVGGKKPDFEAYRKKLNAKLRVGSVTIGQEDAWEEKEGLRRDRDWRIKTDHRPKRFRPYGNPGPGTLARTVKVTKAKACTYTWMRERLRSSWKGDSLPCTLVVEASKVLNVDAYRPGDFKQFFDDPRTRADYLRWAPLLLEAEEYKAGNRKVGPQEDS